ncbi:LOW QUALITY PROTEIN: cyclic nucleotide-gated ion channel 1 [Vigna angularis]|uniref:LOW QUALITY PROTEIN: cyclic nucleotide-gated ion channel 1 n=1 Tax=Phaseolus angularis TaxID=3914 RepID=UPI0022B2BB60|nr:LOW QUALITY PROTEIN: cyclic nucleotide-gated ion channel 1 [Vigna angularis]
MFEKMDDQLLDAMCDKLQPVLYTEESCIVREGDPVDEMLFIMRGKLLTVTTNGGRTGFFNSEYLKAGDFCGEELLTWALDPHSSSNLPISTRTVQTLSEVEAFSLKADDLKFVASQFRRLHSKQLRHTFRFYSQQWRTWAACFIQAAWRRYSKKKLEESLREEENRLQDALAKAGGSSPSLGATIYASRFAANALRLLRRNSTTKTRVPERYHPYCCRSLLSLILLLKNNSCRRIKVVDAWFCKTRKKDESEGNINMKMTFLIEGQNGISFICFIL